MRSAPCDLQLQYKSLGPTQGLSRRGVTCEERVSNSTVSLAVPKQYEAGLSCAGGRDPVQRDVGCAETPQRVHIPQREETDRR